MYLFPFEYIKQNADIVIYGCGAVGRAFMKQIQFTKYCRILFALDRNSKEGTIIEGISVYPPSYLEGKAEYGVFFVVAIDNQAVAEEVAILLQSYGIEKKKIILACNRDFEAPKESFLPVNAYDKQTDCLYIGIINGGGMGDVFMDLQLIKEIRKAVGKPVHIDFYARPVNILSKLPFVDEVFSYGEYRKEIVYDILIRSHRIWKIEGFNKKKVRHFSEQLYKYCIDSINLFEAVFKRQMQNNLIQQYALINGKKRIEQHNIHETLPFTRYTPPYLPVDEMQYNLFDDLDLTGKQYITVSRGVNSLYDNTNAKLWPGEYYEMLLASIHVQFPDIKIIQLGQTRHFGELNGADISLLGKTTLEQTKLLLKNAVLHIDSEGGLVHLNHFLYGKSAVMFGPTVMEAYGYDENFNFKTNACPYPCEWVTDRWGESGTCLLDQDKPACIYSLKPEAVFQKLKVYLENRPINQFHIITWLHKDRLDLESVSILQKKAAVIGRNLQNIAVKYAKEGAEVTLFDHCLTLSGSPSDKDCGYIKEMEKHHITADFGTNYAVSAFDSSFDIVVASLDQYSMYYTFILRELLRLLKQNGIAVLYFDQLFSNWDTLAACFLEQEREQFKTGQKAVVLQKV